MSAIPLPCVPNEDVIGVLATANHYIEQPEAPGTLPLEFIRPDGTTTKQRAGHTILLYEKLETGELLFVEDVTPAFFDANFTATD